MTKLSKPAKKVILDMIHCYELNNNAPSYYLKRGFYQKNEAVSMLLSSLFMILSAIFVKFWLVEKISYFSYSSLFMVIFCMISLMYFAMSLVLGFFSSFKQYFNYLVVLKIKQKIYSIQQKMSSKKKPLIESELKEHYPEIKNWFEENNLLDSLKKLIREMNESSGRVEINIQNIKNLLSRKEVLVVKHNQKFVTMNELESDHLFSQENVKFFEKSS